MRANEESARKAQLLKDAWHGKRLKMKDGMPLTKVSIVAQVGDDREVDVVEERAEVVRRVFDMTLTGVGQQSIAATLNREGVEVLGARSVGTGRP